MEDSYAILGNGLERRSAACPASAPAADLLAELAGMRESLRDDREDGAKGRSVCSDEVLEEMARRLPVRAEDLAAIPGVGQRFIDQYGEAFLEITGRYSAAASGGIGLRCETAAALREMEKDLADLGRGNRMLFQSRLYGSSGLDLTQIPGADILGMLFSGGSVSTADADRITRRHAVEIVREANRELRDRGSFDLYAAYPFAEGRLEDGFSVRAPLALFPVCVAREKGTVAISVDPSRDVIFNGTLILAGMRASGADCPLPECTAEDASAEGFAACMSAFYSGQGIRIQWDMEDPVPFEGGEPDSMGHYACGEIRAVPFAVLGRYPLYSGSVQKDFGAIISGNAVSGILDRFVAKPKPEPMPETEVTEKDLFCAGPLDPSQERIIAALGRTDCIVIHGPPGTGKSQVITEAVISAAAKGMNVLVVSEKKTALDVVRSRLGDLSDYCMMADDAGDKASFYGQLNRMLSLEEPPEAPEIGPINDSIESALGKLGSIGDSLCGIRESGLDPMRLYTEDLERRLPGKGIPADVLGNVPKKAGEMGYSEAAEMHALFSDPAKAALYRDYKEITRKYPILLALKDGLTGQDISDLRRGIESLASLGSDGALARSNGKAREENAAASLIGKYFSGYSRSIADTLLRDPEGSAAALDSYWTYSAGEAAFGDLPWPWKAYGNGMLELASSGLSLAESEAEMFKAVESSQISGFDSEFDASPLEGFGGCLEEADALMGRKRKAVRALVRRKLHGYLSEIRDSRRSADIARISGSKRRWSPGRFMGRFGYELMGGIRIWLLTPEAVSEMLPLEIGLFDLAIFDEASQMRTERGVPSLYRAKKAAVAGDPKQLRPASIGTGRYRDGDESLLDAACPRFPSFLLSYHYRSRYSELIEFSNRAFYGGRLMAAPNVSEPESPAIEVHVTDGIWEDRRNAKEAHAAVDILRRVLSERRCGETVGIITFNSFQRDLINDVLDDACASDPAFGRAVSEEMRRTENGEDVGLFIKNIESVQGDERDVIIFSCGYGRNREGKFLQRFGWLSAKGGENRLNVAITRARQKTILIRSFDPDGIRTDGILGGPEIFRRYVKYADAVSAGDREEARRILDSFAPADFRGAENEGPALDIIGEKLRAAGLDVEKDVGLGGYRMGLAVRKDGNRVLGIELDRTLYMSDPDPRSRDCLRRRYLDSRGWKVMRVWTPLIWRDPDGVAASIIDASGFTKESMKHK